MAYDRYGQDTHSPGWHMFEDQKRRAVAVTARDDSTRRQAEQLALADRRARVDAESRHAVESAVARDALSPGDQGARLLAGVVMNYDRTVKKLQAMVGAEDFAGAQKEYDDFRKIISDNVDDLTGFTRDAVRGSGPLGARLAAAADNMLSGAFDDVKVRVPGEPEDVTLGEVLGPSATYQGYKRKSLADFGFSEAAADMYFGDDDVARGLMRRVANPFVAAKADGSSPPPDRIQLAGLADYLSHRDGDGKFVNMDRLRETFGSSAGAVLDKVVDRHRDVGGYSHGLDLFVQLGETVRADGETGEALAARVASIYDGLYTSTFAGVPPENISVRDKLLFDSVLTKTFSELKDEGRPLDPTSPALVKELKSCWDTLQWARELDVDLVGICSDAGESFATSEAKWAAGRMAGNAVPGIVATTKELQQGLSGVRGAREPSATHAGSRAEGASAPGKTVLATSQLTGLDRMAQGFQKAVVGNFTPVFIENRTTLDGARKAVFGDDARRTKFLKDLTDEVQGFIPFGSRDLHGKIALALWSAWEDSGGTAMCVEDVLDGLLVDNKARRVFSDSDAEALATWMAANADLSEEKTLWRDILTQHYARTIDDAGMRDKIVASEMAELQKARKSGGKVASDEYLDAIVSNMDYLELTRIVDQNGLFGTSEYYRDKDGKPANSYVGVKHGDVREVAKARGMSLPQFLEEQRALRMRMEAEDKARQAYIARQLAAQAKQNNQGSGATPPSIVP